MHAQRKVQFAIHNVCYWVKKKLEEYRLCSNKKNDSSGRTSSGLTREVSLFAAAGKALVHIISPSLFWLRICKRLVSQLWKCCMHSGKVVHLTDTFVHTCIRLLTVIVRWHAISLRSSDGVVRMLFRHRGKSDFKMLVCLVTGPLFEWRIQRRYGINNSPYSSIVYIHCVPKT